MTTTPTPTKTHRNSAKWLQYALQHAKPGNRNAAIFQALCQLRDDGCPREEALAAAEKLAAQVGGDYTLQEALASVHSAYSRPPRQPAQAKQKTRNSSLREVAKPMQPVPQPALRPEDWRQQTEQHIRRAAARLLTEQGAIARTYLHRRKIAPETAQACGIGATWQYNRPALSFPQYDLIGALTAVNYRFCDDAPNRPRYSLRKGSRKTGLFTCPLAEFGAQKLIIFEGDLNAVSAWQEAACYALSVDAVSIGSEGVTAAQIAALSGLAARYAQVICWMDKPENARRLATALPHSQPYQSYVDAGHKLDANQMVMDGYDLAGLLKIL